MEKFLGPRTLEVIGKRFVGTSLAIVVAGSTMAQGPSTDTFVQRALANHGSGRLSVIVRSAEPLSARAEAKLGKFGGYVYRHLPIIHSTAINIPAKNLRRLMGESYVDHVSLDSSVRKTDAFTVGASGADVAWQNYNATGNGIGVAVLDSGIKSSEDFGNRIRAEVNLSGAGGGTDDKCGHGTHVAGIIAGNAANSTGPGFFQSYYGVAPSAALVNVRVLDSQGAGDVSNVIAGVQWVINHRAQYSIRVINASLGHPIGESYTTDPLCQALEAAWKSGIVVVCSAGNGGRLNSTQGSNVQDNEGWGTAYGSIQSPGNDPYVITVGAMKDGGTNKAGDKIATYSSRGPSRLDFIVKPDIVAPGNQIVSVLAKNGYLDKNYSDTNSVMLSEYYNGKKKDRESKDYFRLSGTSMAAPVVAGAAALMLQLDPSLSPDTVKARLMVSADKWVAPSTYGDVFTFGAGYLNIPAALGSSIVATQYAMSPTAVHNADGSVQLYMDRAMWGTGLTDLRAIWGERALWGTDLTVSPDPDARAIWGTIEPAPDSPDARAIWGTDTPTPEARAIWGTSVWSDSTQTTISQAGADVSWLAIGGE